MQIRFGCLSPSITEQVTEEGIPFDKGEMEWCDKAADCIDFLRIRSILADTEVDKARRRLVKVIGKAIDKGGNTDGND